MVISAVLAVVVIAFGCMLVGSVISQSSLLLGSFSFGGIMGGFGAMQNVLLVTIEGGLVFIMLMGGAKIVLSQRLVRFISYPKMARTRGVATRPVRVGGGYSGARRVGTVPAPQRSHTGARVPARPSRA